MKASDFETVGAFLLFGMVAVLGYFGYQAYQKSLEVEKQFDNTWGKVSTAVDALTGPLIHPRQYSNVDPYTGQVIQ